MGRQLLGGIRLPALVMDVDGGPAYEGLAGTYPANTTSIPGLGPCPLSWCWGWVVMAVSSDGQTSAYASVQTRQP